MKTPVRARLDHLVSLADDRGLFEHALGTAVRVEHGYCTDDNARLLVVTSRAHDSGDAGRLSRIALEFVHDAQAPDGRFRNRMAPDGTFTDRPTTNDCWGRAIWGLGVAARQHGDAKVRNSSFDLASRSMERRSTALRATSFAVLGASEILAVDPEHRAARAVLADFADAYVPSERKGWPWPEKRLTYANAVVPDALVAAGTGLGRPEVVEQGLAVLRWLVATQTRAVHLSVVGQEGRSPRDPVGPQFDQQPIEVATLADACWRAFEVTTDRRWANVVVKAARWFEGENDTGTPMMDPDTGGGYDGLQPTSANQNQGAESTLALVSTMQLANRIVAAV